MDKKLFNEFLNGIREAGKVKRDEISASRIFEHNLSGDNVRQANTNNFMIYKGYYGSVHFAVEDQCFQGEIEYIRALVTYEGVSSEDMQIAFEHAVDDYLETCKIHNIPPEKSLLK